MPPVPVGIIDASTCVVADRIRIEGNLELDDGLRTDGTLRLPNAVVGGYLRLSGARLCGPHGASERGIALLGDGMDVGGDLEGRDHGRGALACEGQLRLVGAQRRRYADADLVERTWGSCSAGPSGSGTGPGSRCAGWCCARCSVAPGSPRTSRNRSTGPEPGVQPVAVRRRHPAADREPRPGRLLAAGRARRSGSPAGWSRRVGSWRRRLRRVRPEYSKECDPGRTHPNGWICPGGCSHRIRPVSLYGCPRCGCRGAPLWGAALRHPGGTR